MRSMSTTALYGLRDYLYGTLSTKDMIWLVEQLGSYIRKDESLPPYTLEELNARIAKSEQDAAEGRYMSHQEVFESINHFNTLLS